MISHFPLISVIVPAYNAEAFIAQTLKSVLSQTYSNIEVLVVDDGSQDRTPEIVKLIAQKDRRVRLLWQSNAGVAAARNLAIQKSRGEYIAPIDADDIWYSQKLEKQVQLMLEVEPSVGLVYAWSAYINEEGLLTGSGQASILEGEVYIPLIYSNFLGNASTPLIRRTCFKQVGGYNCQLKENNAQGCEDWELYLRIAEYYQFRVVPEFLLGYRQVLGSMASNCTSMARSYHLVIADVQQRHPEIHPIIYQWSSSNFYFYLAGKSNQCGDYWNTISYLYKASRLDFLPLLRPRLYRLLIVSLLKIAAKPVTSVIWPDHHSWLKFQQRVRLIYRELKIFHLNRKQIKNPQRFPWKKYNWFMSQRWSRIENSRQLFFSGSNAICERVTR